MLEWRKMGYHKGIREKEEKLAQQDQNEGK